MWHSNMNGIFVEDGQMKIGIILRCYKMKTLFGCMMIGVFLWLCCMIVEEYILGCWMDECIWLKCIPCSVWWPLKMAQMGWKMAFDRLMGCEKLEFFLTDCEFLFFLLFGKVFVTTLVVFVCGSIVFKIFGNVCALFLIPSVLHGWCINNPGRRGKSPRDLWIYFFPSKCEFVTNCSEI